MYSIKFVYLFTGCCIGLLGGARGYCPVQNLSVTTSVGVVVGIVSGTTPDVRQFLGVPYAKPPIEERRWLPPIALPRSKDVLDATKFSPACPQFESPSPSVYSRDAREFLINGPTGEDCLTLSIWAPATTDKQSLPVLIFIHGGGFGNGGSSVPYQNPAKWVQRTQSHIVVTIQYRLGIFGFPNAQGLKSQNLGILDQRMAIEWVQSNIAAFGGDARRIVLWGQSAGAASVDFLNFAYYSNPIATGLVCDSGDVFLPILSQDVTQSNFTFVAKQFNCTGSEELDCMREVPSSDIEALFLETGPISAAINTLSFTPIPDEIVVFSNYTQRYEEKKLADIPAIMGTNADEVSGFLYNQWPNPTPPNQTEIDEINLSLFVCPTVSSIRLRQAADRTTFQYQYRGNFSNISPRPFLGAYHSSELPLIFGTYGDERGPRTPFQADVSIRMQDLWLTFVLDPENGLSKNGWNDSSKGVLEALGDTETRIVAELVSAETLDSQCSS